MFDRDQMKIAVAATENNESADVSYYGQRDRDDAT